jgi:hypothetical protein
MIGLHFSYFECWLISDTSTLSQRNSGIRQDCELSGGSGTKQKGRKSSSIPLIEGAHKTLMNLLFDRREFITTCAGVLLLPRALFALGTESQDRDLHKILQELPQSRPHIDRMQASCEQYSAIFPVPLIWPAKMQAIESGYNPNAISNSFAVGSAQFMHSTARELGARLPNVEEFRQQDDVLAMRKEYQVNMDEAIEAFKKGDDQLAGRLREEAQTFWEKYEKSHQTTMADFKQRMFALSIEDRRVFDSRFDPATSDDMIVHYMAILARTIKKELDLVDDPYILLLAAVAYNAGPGNVKRSAGIPVVAQNVGYANKIMVFQKVKF